MSKTRRYMTLRDGDNVVFENAMIGRISSENNEITVELIDNVPCYEELALLVGRAGYFTVGIHEWHIGHGTTIQNQYQYTDVVLKSVEFINYDYSGGDGYIEIKMYFKECVLTWSDSNINEQRDY